MKKVLIGILALVSSLSFYAQEKVEPSPIMWYDIETAMKLYQKHPKPILIDVYTDWCKWCHYMMKTTYANPSLAGYINNNFYPVRFDAETSDTIVFQGKTYVKQGRVNQLATFLLDGRLSYPSTVFFDLRMHKYTVPGYLRIRDIEPLLVYFAEDLSVTANLNDFVLTYMYAAPKRYKDELEKQTLKLDTSSQVNWLTMNEAYQKSQKNPKPIFVFSYVPWCNSCRPMQKVSFRDSAVAAILNNEFYPVLYDASTTDTIKIAGKQYVSMGKGQPNQYSMVLFKQGFRFPAILFLDSNFNLIGNSFGFYTGKQLIPMLKYFSEGYYKKMSFADFVKKYSGN